MARNSLLHAVKGQSLPIFKFLIAVCLLSKVEPLFIELDTESPPTQGQLPDQLYYSPLIPFRDDKTLAVVDYKSDGRTLMSCTLFDLEKYSNADEETQRKLGKPVVDIGFKRMLGIIEECKNLAATVMSVDDNKIETIENVTELWSVWRGIVPGTRWCGVGDEAHEYRDLGSKVRVDLCCRAHDHCPVRLKSFRFGYGLVNLSLYTKSHCDCDVEFLNCLKVAGTPLADVIGNFYFNLMKFGCIEENTGQKSGCSHRRRRADGSSQCAAVPRDVPTMQFVDQKVSY